MGTEKRERQKSNRALKYQEQVKTERRDKTKRNLLRGGLIATGAVVAVIAIAWIGGGDDGGNAADDPQSPAATNQPAGSGPANSNPTGSTPGSQPAPQSDFNYGNGACAPAQKPAQPKREFTGPPKQCIDPAKDYRATFNTAEGEIVVDLNTDQVPGTVNNFVNLSQWGYYDDTSIFRADQSIGIIQGGGNSMSDPFGYTIPDEGAGYTYEAGQLVMARSQGPNSGGAQWFITVNDDASALDSQGTYVVFGEITEGLDVAEQILSLPTAGSMGELADPVKLKSVEITEQ